MMRCGGMVRAPVVVGCLTTGTSTLATAPASVRDGLSGREGRWVKGKSARQGRPCEQSRQESGFVGGDPGAPGRPVQSVPGIGQPRLAKFPRLLGFPPACGFRSGP
eukprot:TRINITY_DN5613_c0_g1_i1.p1 TRINITY_DN5613_c0_g1~~TRINITY_DN5613_c0_g1_i1.p1  ORF type:complete len:106 (-),score=11.46 TRINITY_DN5613_c0_g1_i1:19-336(-)